MSPPLILWVEDNLGDVELVHRAFAELGVAVEFIVPKNAVAAFQYMLGREPYQSSRQPPDLILLDLNLPIMPGTRVLAEAREHPPWKQIPIVVLTSSSEPKELAACLKLGADECITKPAVYEGYLGVVRRLQKYLPRSGGHPTAQTLPSDPIGDPPSSFFVKRVTDRLVTS